MRVRISNIERSIIWLLIFLNATILLFGDFDSLLRYINVATSLILFLVVFFNKKSCARISKYKFHIGWIFLIVTLFWVNGIYCVIKYGVTVRFVFSQI